MTQIHPSRRSDDIRDLVLAQAREDLRAFGREHGFLDAHLCGCGRAGCLNDGPETMSFVAMLRAVASGWTDAPDPARHTVLRERILAFARTFGLECPCGDPYCPSRQVEQGDTRSVVRTVADLWHGRAGNRVNVTSEMITEMAGDHLRNLAALDVLALRMDPRHAPALRDDLHAWEAQEHSAWLAEARAMAAEAIASWLPVPGGMAEVNRVLDAALAVATHGDWTLGEALALEAAAADACSAILVRGFAHDSVSRALFAPFDRIVALSDLQAAADAELLSSRLAA